MAMTEADVEKMAADVLNAVIDPEAQEAWRVEALSSWRAIEQKQMGEWRLARILRDDKAMTAIAEQLQRTRAAITYLIGLKEQA